MKDDLDKLFIKLRLFLMWLLFWGTKLLNCRLIMYFKNVTVFDRWLKNMILQHGVGDALFRLA